MKLRRLFVLGSLLLFGTATFAQDYARVEVPLNYSYVRFNPENSNITHGLSLNGGGGAVVVYFNHFLGIQGEFQGYATAGTRTFTFPASPSSPCPAGCTVSTAICRPWTSPCPICTQGSRWKTSWMVVAYRLMTNGA